MAELARGLATTRLARPGRVVLPGLRNEANVGRLDLGLRNEANVGRLDLGLRNEANVGRLDLLLMTMWFGIMNGLVELGSFHAAGWITGKITYETLRTNWHYAGMIPVSNFLLFMTVGALIGLTTWILPRPMVFRLAAHVYCFLATLSLAMSIPGLYQVAMMALALGAACRLGPRIAGRPIAFRRLVRSTLPVMAIGGLALIVGSFAAVSLSERRALASLPPAPKGAPNVLLLVLDTVRADALSPYGSARDTTPNLARLAGRGVRFDGARSTAPWTLPSHASLFTGRWRHELSVNTGRPLDSTHPTLAGFLAGHGYATAGFVANTHNCNAWYGLGRGFAHYEDFYENATVTPVEILRSSRLGRMVLLSKLGQVAIKAILTTPKYVYRKSAAMINRDALAWLSGQQGRPFFIFLNYYDAHDPYVTPRGTPRKFPRAAAGAGASPGAGTQRPDLLQARDDYDDCLAYLDGQVGKLVDELERRGVLDDTLIIVTADHGEAFGEHGLSGHGVSLYRPELHVPMLFVNPARVPGGRTVPGPVSLRDVPATVADLVGFGDGSPFSGASLARCWDTPVGSEAAPDRPVLSDVDRADHLPPDLAHVPARRGLMQSIAAGRHVYIRNGDGREELYDVESDRDERSDLARSTAAQADLARLRGMLRQVTGSGPVTR